MIEFNHQLTRRMRVYRREITTTHHYNGGGTVTLISKDGSENITVSYEKGLSNNPTEVKFLGSSFRQDSRTRAYRIDRAASLLLQEERTTLEGRELAKKREEVSVKWRKRFDWAREITSTLVQRAIDAIDARLRSKGVEPDEAKHLAEEALPNITVGVPYEREKTYYNISIRVEDQATVLVMIDYLRDGGFITEIEKKEQE